MRPIIFLLFSCLLISSCSTTQSVTGGKSKKVESVFSPDQLLERGVKSYFEGNYTLAEKDLLTVTRLVPNDAMAWFRLGNLYSRQQQLDEAAAAYQQALVRQSNLFKAWHNLGVVQMRLAQRHFLQLQDRAPNDSPLKQRGRFYNQQIDTLLAGPATANHEANIDD